MLSNKVQKALMKWESYEFKIIKAPFKSKEGNAINDIQCYAHTSDRNNYENDQFYEGLKSITVKCSGRDLTILMGDLNAKLGMDYTEDGDIMGQQALKSDI
ncbi:unnamed protein product [Schistosoma margrebowiei]|uniref:Uncharacterized protein n=1 Tax=Schistosoma margrebowiei TaxID=48269 RepID=A0A183M1D4_9TREM|nr:unnamed protein product [Schistosoma margrebowiei]